MERQLSWVNSAVKRIQNRKTKRIYGKTVVDLKSVSGSTLGAAYLILVSFYTKEEG